MRLKLEFDHKQIVQAMDCLFVMFFINIKAGNIDPINWGCGLIDYV